MTPIRRIVPWLLFLSLFFMAPWVSHAADRAAPPMQAGVRITIDNVVPGQETYRVNLNIVQPNRIQRVVMLLENDSGTLVLTREVNPGNNTSIAMDFPTAAMTDAGTYRIKIRAVDLLGNLVERQGDNGQNEEPETLAQREIEFLPDSNRLTFSVLSVNPDYNADRIVVALQLADESRVLSYQGFIRNENGQSIMQIPETIYTKGGTIVLSPIPPAMRNATGTELTDAGTFELHLQLITQGQSGRNTFDLDEPFEFASVPPPPPGMMERIMTTITTNPTVPTLIIFVIGAVVVFFIMRNRKPAPDLPTYRPPVDRTVEIYGDKNNVAALRQVAYASPNAPVRKMRLRIRVIVSPGILPNIEQIIDTFPYVFGRGLWLNDPQMSREHATITMRSGQFFITDNNSRNGTFVRDVRLTAEQPTPLEGSTIVKLGVNSMLEIEPYG